MNKKRKLIKIILNGAGLALYLVAFISFFLTWVYAYIAGAGVAGAYKGYELALNFDGIPQNLGTLFPLLFVLGALIYALIALIKKLANLKKEPKEQTSSPFKVLLLGAFFIICAGIITLFLSLSSLNMLNLSSKKYGGYYLGIGAYLTAYTSLVGGLIMFITESGLIKD